MGGRGGYAARLTLAGLLAVLLLTCAAAARAMTYYSAPGSTDPTRLDTWWTYPDGTGANPLDFASGDMFVIQTGHSLATTGTWAISGAGSALWIQPSGALEVGDGAASRLALTGSTFQLDPGATYVHDSTTPWDSTCFSAGVTHNFDAASTVILRATGSPGTDIAWGNLTVDLATSPGADWSWDGKLTTVYGNLTVTNTGGYAMRLADDSDATLDIHGDLVLDGGNLQLGGGAGATTMNVAGDFVVTAGAFGSSGTAVHTVVFTGGESPRTFTRTGGDFAIGNVDWQVNTGTLTLASDFALPAERALTVGSPGTLVLAAALVDSGTFTLNGTLRLDSSGSVTHALAYGGGGTLIYAGGSRTSGPEWGASGAAAPLHVTLAAGEGNVITLSGSRTLSDTLAFQSGLLATGADTLTLSAGCAVTGADASHYVNGNLARIVPPGLAAPLVFDIGDGTAYTPVTVAFDTVMVEGILAAGTAVPGVAPVAGVPPAGAGLSDTSYVDRSWTLTSSSAYPVGFGSCSATFHFVSADLRGTCDTSAFVVARSDGGAWSRPSVSDRLATSITALGLPGFGEFRVGEPAVIFHALVATAKGPGTVTKTPDADLYESGTVVVLTATAAKGWVFTGWSGDTADSANPLTLTVNRPWNVTAVFEAATVVVSQVYGGGGAGDSPCTNDFIELYNAGLRAMDVTGWTVQCAGATDSVWSATVLAGTIPAGGYYLVQQAGGPAGDAALPTPDATGSVDMDATAGKVALVSGGAPLGGNCPDDARVVDLVGYGAADCAEGAPVDVLGSTTAALRGGEGCDDSGDNLLDFTIAAPAPRNSASPIRSCAAWAAVEPTPVTRLALAPVAPNPSRGSARISYSLPAASGVKLQVLDIQGRVVATLLDGVMPAGRHEARWEGAARSGLYFVRLQACGQRVVRSAILVR